MKKRGVSEIVSYVLLVVVALVIAGLVYTFLKVYVPKEKPECRDGINVIIQDAVCIIDSSDRNIKLTVQNRGLFKTDAIYVRVGIKDRKFKALINDPEDNSAGIPETDWGFVLIPGNSRSIPEDVNKFLKIPENIKNINPSSENYVLEIQPATVEEGRIDTLSLCPPIKQEITCT
jgi:flagellin-like protein